MKCNFYEISFKIDELIQNYSLENLKKITQYFKCEGIESYFFKKLASSPNSFPWLQPLKERGYFDPQNNPLPQEVHGKKGYFFIPEWNILEYLENVAAKNKKTPSKEITNTLLEIIDSIIKFRDKTGKRIDNYRTDWKIVKIIFLLPIDKITEEHIGLLETALKTEWDSSLIASEIGETVLPKLINEKAKDLLLQLLNFILDYKKVKGNPIFGEEESYEYNSMLNEYWLRKTITKYKKKIAGLCGIEAAEIALKKIKAIVNESKQQFNNIWIPTIEENLQTFFPERYECQLVYFVRDMFEFSEPQKMKEKIRNLLKEEHPIFKRIAFHTIDFHYEKLKDLFWNLDNNPLEEKYANHEVYELLKNNSSSFSEEEINKALQWIESKKYYIPQDIKDDKDQIEKILAYRKKEWLSALLATKDKDVISSYKKYDQINPSSFEHPGFSLGIETKEEHEPPIEESKLLEMTNEEIVKYLNDINNGTKETDMQGVLDVLSSCVSKNPEKFTNNIKPFLKAQRMYQYALIAGLNEAWDLKKKIEWQSIIDFVSQIITSSDFWNEDYKGYDYKNWLISDIARLIENGVKGKDNLLDTKLLPKAENVLLILAQKTKSDLTDMNDIITSVLNSAKGKVFSAMISYSLRYAYLQKKDSKGKWKNSIKKDFTKRLDRKFETSLEFSVILGEYLASLYWLDKDWVVENINKIFPKNNDDHWEAAFTAYLFYSPRVYRDLYFLLRENEHYTKAIKTEFNDSHITERLVHHICIGYLEDWEKLEDKESLIFQLIENKNINQLSAIVNFLWILRERFNSDVKKEKIIPLWRRLYNLAKENEEDSEYQKLISNLSKWLLLVDEINDEVFEWLKLSAKYIDRGSSLPFFIENLSMHVTKTPKKVGKIYLEMLNANIYPDYEKESIQKTVRILYDQGYREIANSICNSYGEKGFEFLRKTYIKYNKKNFGFN